MHSTIIITNLIWRFAEKLGAQGISLIVTIVMARLLTPNEYGLVAFLMIFISILNVFVDSGLGNALIQKKDADQYDFSTVFYFNVFICFVLYVLLFIAAPLISNFYKELILTPLLRVLGLTLIVSGIKNIQQAYISRKMMFKRFFYATLIGTIISGFTGIIMAYKGFGIWALVGQYLSNTVVDTFVLWFTVKWRPTLYFSFERFKILFSFGWKLLVSALLDTGYRNLKGLIIGKYYTKADLAYYNNGDKFPQLIVSNVNSSIGSVLFPYMSQEQENKEMLKKHMRMAIRISSYIMWPLLIGLGVCGNSIISLLLTDKWLPAVPFLQIACFSYGLWPIHTVNLQAIQAMGRSDLFLKLELLKKIIGLLCIVIAMKYGVLALALIGIPTSIISLFINAWPNKKLLKYNYMEQIKDIMPSFLLALFMGGIVLIIGYIDISKTLLLFCLQIPLGVIVYILGSILLRYNEFYYILNKIKMIVNFK